MSRIKASNAKVREVGRDGQIVRELSDREIAQITGAVSCSWREDGIGWITHGGYPPKD